MSNQLEQQKKVFSCFTCKSDVHLVRNEQGQKWDKFNLDGSEHNCQKKKFSKQSADMTEIKAMLAQILAKVQNIEKQTAAR